MSCVRVSRNGSPRRSRQDAFAASSRRIEQRLATRFDRRHAIPQIVFDVEFEVRFEFFGKFAVARRPPNKPAIRNKNARSDLTSVPSRRL